MNKQILVVSQYFYPENFRINNICDEWVKRGYKLTVVTGIPNYPRGRFFKGFGYFKKRSEYLNGIRIIRLPIIPRGRKPITLMLNYLSFVVSGWIWKTFTKVKADLVFNFEVSPMTQALPAVWFAKRKKIPCFVYVQDLWPENVEIVGGIKNRRLLAFIGKIVDYIYKRTSLILVTSESFKRSIIKRGVSEDKVVFWPQYAEDFFKPYDKETVESKKFNVMFTGNIGDAQGLDILPKLALILKENNLSDNIIFTLVGDGRNKENLIKLIASLNLNKMFVFESQKKPEEIPNYLSKADVAFVSFAENDLFRMTIPAKLQTYLACGKPILAVASGETERIINEAGCGLTSVPGNVEDAYKNLIFLFEMNNEEIKKMGNNALVYSQKNFNKKTLMDQMDSIILREVK